MGKLRRYIDHLSQFTHERMESEVLNIIDDQEPAAVDLITQNQLMFGLDGEGKDLGEYASQAYAEFKLSLNPRGVVDLRLTGAFHESIFMNADQFPVVFGATDEKTDKLLDRYGDNILTLRRENIRLLAKGYVADPLKDFYRKVFHL